ncbi:MAG: TlpA disulfide reductase family protein [Paracoccaceae bacterium]|jgi:thiol-disulfide isomerase/thioredoxin
MKRPLLTALLYAALSVGANPAAAIDAETRQAILDMRIDEMRKMKILTEASDMITVEFQDADSNKMTFADTNGQFRLVNFWATWCAPCREEMPALDALQVEMGGEDFQVMTIATGRNRLSGIHKFYAEAEVTNLPILLDPKGKLAKRMGVVGLPVTILLDREGREIARLTGGADWASENAIAVIRALMEGS